jgi:hypothetical protein
LDDLVKMIRSVLEEGSFDLGAVRVDKRDVENRAGVLSLSFWRLVQNAALDGPVF